MELQSKAGRLDLTTCWPSRLGLEPANSIRFLAITTTMCMAALFDPVEWQQSNTNYIPTEISSATYSPTLFRFFKMCSRNNLRQLTAVLAPELLSRKNTMKL